MEGVDAGYAARQQPVSSGNTQTEAAVWLEFDPLRESASKQSETEAIASTSNSAVGDLDLDVATALASSTAVLSKCRRKRLSRIDTSEIGSSRINRRIIRTIGAAEVPQISPPKAGINRKETGRRRKKTPSQ